jgi:FAD/FMN-containing dehydrogenase
MPPAVIARCTGAADVVAAVRFAREHDLRISMKGGGHGVAGKAVCDGGLTIEFSHEEYPRRSRRAHRPRGTGSDRSRARPRNASFCSRNTGRHRLHDRDLGLTLGGGQSWLASKHGFAIDNLLSVDIVTADGTLRSVSATQHEDLFWAVRGAGHNFGVVTSFEYRLHPVGPVLGGLVIHPLSQAVEVLRFYREFTASNPTNCRPGRES